MTTEQLAWEVIRKLRERKQLADWASLYVLDDELAQLLADAIDTEREACAKIVERKPYATLVAPSGEAHWDAAALDLIARDIRARGK